LGAKKCARNEPRAKLPSTDGFSLTFFLINSEFPNYQERMYILYMNIFLSKSSNPKLLSGNVSFKNLEKHISKKLRSSPSNVAEKKTARVF